MQTLSLLSYYSIIFTASKLRILAVIKGILQTVNLHLRFLYTKTKKRNLIDLLFQHGICTYDRVLEISTTLGDAVIKKYLVGGVVCPSILQKGVFTTSAVDNIDHNPSATTAMTLFHGTGISVFSTPQ